MIISIWKNLMFVLVNATQEALSVALAAKKMKQELTSQCGLTEEEAVEIINILPKSLPKTI